jgi:DnaJ-class molecular chaperone
MKGKGIVGRYRKGDQLVHIRILVPKKLSKKQRQIIEELGKELESKPNSRAWWWR